LGLGSPSPTDQEQGRIQKYRLGGYIHVGQYGERRARAYKRGSGPCPWTLLGAQAQIVWGLCPSRVQGQSPWLGGQEVKPLKLNTFLCCELVICLKWHKAAMFMDGSPPAESRSRALVGSLGTPEAEAFFVKLHIIFALKYNKQ